MKLLLNEDHVEWSAKQKAKTRLFFLNVSHPVVFLIFIQDTNSGQTQQFYYIITFKATCCKSIGSSTGLLENGANVLTFIVHFGIPKAYNKWYSQYKSTCVRDLIILTFNTLLYIQFKSLTRVLLY